jgi:damage-control phosphatase, subfamily I
MEAVAINKSEEIDERCIDCFIRLYRSLFRKKGLDNSEFERFADQIRKTSKENKHLSGPGIQRLLNRDFCNLVGIIDPFKEQKENSNRIALELYNTWKPRVNVSDDPFHLALRLAIAGNIMDYGANDHFDISKTIDHALQAKLAIDHSLDLKHKIKEAKSILYLGDNAGEIVFDKLLIETIHHKNVTYAVKHGPALNDVNFQDAFEVGMDTVADVISNGYNAPSTLLEKCSKEFMKAFNSADLIISKGQGNVEGLIHLNDSRIFYLLMVKCDVIADVLKLAKGSLVVSNSFHLK